MTKKVLVKGLRCENCPIHISEKVSDISGIEKMDTNMDEKTLTMTCSDDVNVSAIKDALADKPFTVEEVN